MEGDHESRGRIVARWDPRIGFGRRLQDAPAPLDDRMAPRINADTPVEPRDRAICERLEHDALPSVGEAVAGARFGTRNDEGFPAPGRRLAGAARRELRRFHLRAALEPKLGDDCS